MVSERPAWWSIPVTPTLGREKQEDHKFKIIVSYKVSLRLVLII